MLTFTVNGYRVSSAPVSGHLASATSPSEEVWIEEARAALHEEVMRCIREHRDFDQCRWIQEVLLAGEAA
jgi:hypothetical protein